MAGVTFQPRIWPQNVTKHLADCSFLKLEPANDWNWMIELLWINNQFGKSVFGFIWSTDHSSTRRDIKPALCRALRSGNVSCFISYASSFRRPFFCVRSNLAWFYCLGLCLRLMWTPGGGAAIQEWCRTACGQSCCVMYVFPQDIDGQDGSCCEEMKWLHRHQSEGWIGLFLSATVYFPVFPVRAAVVQSATVLVSVISLRL